MTQSSPTPFKLGLLLQISGISHFWTLVEVQTQCEVKQLHRRSFPSRNLYLQFPTAESSRSAGGKHFIRCSTVALQANVRLLEIIVGLLLLLLLLLLLTHLGKRVWVGGEDLSIETPMEEEVEDEKEEDSLPTLLDSSSLATLM
uniref:Expressed conserved protein n=1 Tax=Echinococcus granulosus TaxID=6210 RepID=U6FU21_ECHGR|nr:hypothetical protein EgrG_002067300 [Echinococcus granulosus]